MGLYIKDMEMPDRDHLVLVEIDSNGDMFAAYDGGRTKLTQYKASLVPEPHGRLIDADLIMATLSDSCKRVFGDDDIPESSGLSIVADYIDAAPTVIPASEEVET